MSVRSVLPDEMRRATAVFAALLVVVAGPVGVAAAGGYASVQTGTPTEAAGNATATAGGNATAEPAEERESVALSPGAQLAGVLAVQRAEIGGEVETRAFGLRVSRAATSESKARIVADQLNETEARLDELRGRLSELRQARESGEISAGRYRAQAARLTAEIRTLQRLLNRSADVAHELPADVKRTHGIAPEEVERLRTEARNLTGEEVSAIARRVAGPNVGNGIGGGDAPGRSGDRGPPSDRGRPENAGDDRPRSDALSDRFDRAGPPSAPPGHADVPDRSARGAVGTDGATTTDDGTTDEATTTGDGGS
jgi:hypothetical protein